MSSLVASVVRRPREIIVRYLTRNPEVAVGRRAVGLNAYSLTDRALADVGDLDLPQGRRLRRAFDALSQVEFIDSEIFEHVLWVLLGTVPSAQPLDLPPALPAPPTPVARRTAAHPRGFRGTKYQPPKPARPRAIDLRPSLCDRAAGRQILQRGWPLRQHVLPAVADDLGLPRKRVDRWLKQESPPESLFAGPWSKGPSHPRSSSSTDAVENLLWLVRDQSQPTVEHLFALYDRLVQPAGGISAADLVRLVARVPADRAVQWLAETERQPPEQRAIFLSAALESDVAQHAEPCRRLLHSLADRAQESRYQPWAGRLLEAQSQGVDPAYLEAGVRLMAEHRPDHYFHNIRNCPDYDEAVIERLLLRVPSIEIPSIAASLWQAVGWMPQLMGHLRELQPDALAPRVLVLYLHFLDDLGRQSEDVPMEAERWAAIRELLPDIQDLLATVPPSHGEQASADLARIVEHWTESWEIECYLPWAIELFERVQQPPLNPDGHLSHALRELLEVDLPDLDRLLEAPLAAFARLDKACRRKNDGQLIGWGLSSLARYPKLVIAGFEAETATLTRIAKILGAYNWQERARLLESWKPGRLLEDDIEAMPVSELVDLVSVSNAGAQVVPKALREFLADRHQLTDRQVEGHRRRLVDRLTFIRLTSLQQHIVGEMGQIVGDPRPDKDLQLALQFLADAGPSRRGLRRFLRRYLAGHESYLLDHPANQAWLQRRPELDPALWTTGIQTEARDSQGRAVALTLEQNPFEILKMGTYVGSCLGLGGDYSWSAVSVLLDINKQVIYARDSGGQVLARQLLAVSSRQELVPFEVYPQVDEPMLDAFRAYDQAFAQALGLEINTDWEVEIENVVAKIWWNDHPWDELIPTSTRTEPDED